MRFSIKDFFSKRDQVFNFLLDLVTFTEFIFNGKLFVECYPSITDVWEDLKYVSAQIKFKDDKAIFGLLLFNRIVFNPLSANHAKWSNSLK